MKLEEIYDLSDLPHASLDFSALVYSSSKHGKVPGFLLPSALQNVHPRAHVLNQSDPEQCPVSPVGW